MKVYKYLHSLIFPHQSILISVFWLSTVEIGKLLPVRVNQANRDSIE